MLMGNIISLIVSSIYMPKGILLALLSGALWGILLVVPEWLNDFSAAEITFGRFLVFGVLVSLLILFRRDSFIKSLSLANTNGYLMLSLFGNILYYLSLIGSIRFVGVLPVCVLIGTLPVFGGEWIHLCM